MCHRQIAIFKLNVDWLLKLLSSELLLESRNMTDCNIGFISWGECYNMEGLCDYHWRFSLLGWQNLTLICLESTCTTVLVVERSCKMSLVTLLKFRTVWDLVAHHTILLNVHSVCTSCEWLVRCFECNTIQRVSLTFLELTARHIWLLSLTNMFWLLYVSSNFFSLCIYLYMSISILYFKIKKKAWTHLSYLMVLVFYCFYKIC